MNRIACLVLTSLLLFVTQAFAQDKSLEKIVRETYKKLENYNAAAQVFQNEYTKKVSRSEANLSFELSDFRSGDVRDILYKRYAELVTTATGDVISLTRGGHSLDGGPQEATYAAAWEPGRYASVFDPMWTISDVFHFEAARYYDVKKYVGYQVTVKLEGRSRTYRALALFRESQDSLGVLGCDREWGWRGLERKTPGVQIQDTGHDIGIVWNDFLCRGRGRRQRKTRSRDHRRRPICPRWWRRDTGTKFHSAAIVAQPGG